VKKIDKIKAGLNHCINADGCCGCVYHDECMKATDCNPMHKDILAYIHTYEEMNEKLINTIGRLTGVINALADQIPRWVSVEDALPDDDVNVLVYAIGNNENSVVAMTSYTHNMHGYNIEGWRSPWQYFFYEYKITHWMLLPEAPEEDDHD